MSKIIFVPDTNFFLYHSDFISFFNPVRTGVHLDVLWPVLCELDRHRSKRNGKWPDEKDRGQKAFEAMQLIRDIQEHPRDDFELEISTPDGIDPSLPADAQIVAHLVRLAKEQHANETIEFITNDGGLPTLWFIEEKKRHNLKNVNIKTDEEIRKAIAEYGTPSAKFENIECAHKLVILPDNAEGVEISFEYTVSDMRGCEVKIGIYLHTIRNIGHIQIKPIIKYKHEKIFISTSEFQGPPVNFFLPYSMLEEHLRSAYPGVSIKEAIRQNNMEIVNCTLYICDNENKNYLAENNFSINYSENH